MNMLAKGGGPRMGLTDSSSETLVNDVTTRTTQGTLLKPWPRCTQLAAETLKLRTEKGLAQAVNLAGPLRGRKNLFEKHCIMHPLRSSWKPC
jgi:hypothetical protein